MERGPARRVAAAVTTVLAALLIWFALVAPSEMHDLTFGAFVRLPLEGLLLAALILVLPARARRPVALVLGAVLGVLIIVKLIDVGFSVALDRPFNPVTDWGYLASAAGLLSDGMGQIGVVLVVLLVVAVIVLTPLAAMRLSRVVAGHRAASIRTVTAACTVWVLCAVLGVQIISGTSIASTATADFAVEQVNLVRAGIADHDVFAAAVADDQFGTAAPAVPVRPAAAPATTSAAPPTSGSASTTPPTPPGAAAAAGTGELLAGLQGKDVIIAFVEAYGRVALENPTMAPQIGSTLDAGTKALGQAGYTAQSAFLHSPTFGGLSWLAHATLQSGLWIDNQQRYDQLISSKRVTLASAFKSAGWRTVGDVPSNEKKWPEGAAFYQYDKIYDETNVGYRGPSFSYASMPDQYVLSAFQRLELARPDRGPVMAEIDLVSSHWPWAPIPHLIGWSKVGDGSVFNGMPEQGESPDVISKDQARTRAAYADSIRYTMNTLISFVQNYGDENLVLIVLGDHEPASTVSGEKTSHDVPISIITHDPAVLERISAWGWQDGLRPAPDAPVWPMDAFRDRFLTAYRG
ncbi:sulfatase [Nakamurella sp. GG22]